MQILVGFSTYKKWHWMSSLIKLVEGAPFSHVYVRVIDGDSDRVCNIAPDEDQSIPYNDFVKVNKIEREFPLSYDPARLEEIIKSLKPKSQVYNFFKIFSIGLARILNNPTAKAVKFLWNRRSGIICTEYTYGILQAAGYNLPIDLQTSGPKKIFDVLKTISDENQKVAK